MPVDPVQAEKFYTCLSAIAKRKVNLPSDYDYTLIKPQKNRIESGKTIPHLGSQQKEHEPLRVLMEKEQHVMEFMWET